MFGKKREIGYGGLFLGPVMWVEPKAMIKELKKELMPFMSKEEEELILSEFQRGNRCIVFVPKAEYMKVQKAKDYEMFSTFTVEASDRNKGKICCTDWWTRGCCAGPVLGHERYRMNAIEIMKPKDELAEELSQYFVR